MKTINTYIIEKLKVDKNVRNVESEDIKKVLSEMATVMDIDPNDKHNEKFNIVKEWVYKYNVDDIDVYCDKKYYEYYLKDIVDLDRYFISILKTIDESLDYAHKYLKGEEKYNNGIIHIYAEPDYLSIQRKHGNIYFIVFK